MGNTTGSGCFQPFRKNGITAWHCLLMAIIFYAPGTIFAADSKGLA
ncbi:hypothetical protein SFMTTN_1426 [Sulfuriferula multivorans]|uniref:Uncharacterized protein n=1 Tax=Sulfuriferula multivorans TaxID=1559896 RepID=A0A401JDH2_9PROT|nr:hypothetical protein SFMTTN_1426 [Sulfuriferula multivorans]